MTYLTATQVLFLNARNHCLLAITFSFALLLSACSVPISTSPSATLTLAATKTSQAPAVTATASQQPTREIPAQFAGPTATQPADPLVTPAPGFWIWNPHQSNAYLQYEPEDWDLIVGGDPKPFVFEGFQGLFHKDMNSCILSLAGGGNAPFTWQNRPEIITLAGLEVHKDVYRNATDVRVMILYAFPAGDFQWTFLLGTASLDVTEACMKAAEQVLDTLVIFP
ncbi:MAG TPA: hypothetical protein VIH14_06095 [Anaerolineales bacterium]